MSAFSRGRYVCHSCLSLLRKSRNEATNGSRRLLSSASSPSLSSRPFQLAIIGSGPAGFYAASRILREHNQTVIDMYERLPVPFGLVRFGVAPDHPEVKNCQDRFEEIASLDNFNFIGNVQLGKDIALPELRQHYDAVLFAYGASKDRLLGIPGEDLSGVLSAREFVAWYNGLPEFEALNPPLIPATGNSSDEAVIIGQGNVALDVARMLLTKVDDLRHTDTPEPVLEALSRSRFKTAHIVGRRGPTQAAFTIKEIRELVGANRRLHPVPALYFPSDLKTLGRARMRIAQLLTAPKNNPDEAAAAKMTRLHFFMSPASFVADGSGALAQTTFAHTRFVGAPANDDAACYKPNTRVEVDEPRAPTNLNSGIAFRSIGYKAEALPGMASIGVSFDEALGIIPNVGGRVLQAERSAGFVPGVYATGWVKRGPTGVIATTMADAFETADAIVADVKAGQQFTTRSAGASASTELPSSAEMGWAAMRKKLAAGVRPVHWKDWKAIDALERERGAKLGKPREKITSVAEMLKVLDG